MTWILELPRHEIIDTFPTMLWYTFTNMVLPQCVLLLRALCTCRWVCMPFFTIDVSHCCTFGTKQILVLANCEFLSVWKIGLSSVKSSGWSWSIGDQLHPIWNLSGNYVIVLLGNEFFKKSFFLCCWMCICLWL